MALPLIGITMGDPAGVGPELCLEAAVDPRVLSVCQPVVFGNGELLEKVRTVCERTASLESFTPPENYDQTGGDFRAKLVDSPSDVKVVSLPSDTVDQVQPGTVDANTGRLSYLCVREAIEATKHRAVDAVVTCPIHKEAWHAAGVDYPGHTELLAEMTQTDNFCMMMTSPTVSCSLVTSHVGYQDVLSLMTTERIVEVIQLTYQSLKLKLGREPKLLALGLNPHAGENGLFGNQEEQTIIQPAVDAARKMGITIEGPVPPDTAFVPAKLKQFDGHICMFHDQGLIPFKALAFDTGVNVTLGLPIVRTSVDHGTALDIAWQNQADVSSLIAAIELAASLAG